MSGPTAKEHKHLQRLNKHRTALVDKKYGPGLLPHEHALLHMYCNCMDAMDLRIYAPAFARMEQQCVDLERAVHMLQDLAKELTEAGISINLEGAGGGDDAMHYTRQPKEKRMAKTPEIKIVQVGAEHALPRKVSVVVHEAPGETRTIEGVFHCWAQDHIEYTDGPAPIACGIVELESGRVLLANPLDLTFLAPDPRLAVPPLVEVSMGEKIDKEIELQLAELVAGAQKEEDPA